MNYDNEMEVFAKNINVLINQRNWTLCEAAIELGYSRKYLSVHALRKRNCRLDTVVRFARTFNVSVFLLFSRAFDNDEYRRHFPFVEVDYMDIIRKSLCKNQIKQASMELDATTVSHIMNGRRNNVTIATLRKLTRNEILLSDLLKTDQDKEIEATLREAGK